MEMETDTTPKLVFNTDWWFYIPEYLEDPDRTYYGDLFTELNYKCQKLYPTQKMERRSCIFSKGGKISYNMGGYDWSTSPTIRLLKEKVEKHFRERFDYCLAHIYAPGSSIAWHNDSEASMTAVLSLSFGETRKFRFRDIGTTRGWRHELKLGHGDLVYMKVGCQFIFEHCVPVEKKALGYRINLTFRKSVKGGVARFEKLRIEAELLHRGKLIYSMGHSNRSTDEFIKLILSARHIKNVVDIRAIPYSRRNPQFNRENLKEILRRQTLFKYYHIPKLGGKKESVLGADSPNTSIEIQGFRNYADYAHTPTFEDGYSELLKIAESQPTLFFCAEAKWWQCHRRILSDILTHRGWKVIHLGALGEVEDSSLEPSPHVIWQAARGHGDKLVYDQ